jgi:predicted acylesterase/phospholipase RssA
MSAGIPVLFRTYPVPKNETYDCAIWEAARATSAAPTIFQNIEINASGLRQFYIDGGAGVNNPSMQVLIEAELVFPGRDAACLISIGTGQPNVISIPKPGLLQQFVPTDVVKAMINIATDCEMTSQAMALRFRDRPDFYFRFNVEQGMQDIELAHWDRLHKVAAHTQQYLKMQEVDQRMGVAVNAIRKQQGVISTSQISTEVENLR